MNFEDGFTVTDEEVEHYLTESELEKFEAEEPNQPLFVRRAMLRKKVDQMTDSETEKIWLVSFSGITNGVSMEDIVGVYGDLKRAVSECVSENYYVCETTPEQISTPVDHVFEHDRVWFPRREERPDSMQEWCDWHGWELPEEYE